MITIIENEPLLSHVNEFDAIIIGTNCYQVMRNGFQYEICQEYPQILDANYSTKYGDINKLGTITEVFGQPTFILAFISFGYNFKGSNSIFLDYDALKKVLQFINIEYKGKKIATTMLGTTEFDGNASQNDVLGIINDTLTNVDCYIFDYKQESGNKIHQNKYYNERKRRRKSNLQS